jgi:hypothetical protein
MATKKTSQIPAANLQPYEKPIATLPEINRKGAVHSSYASVNGHMFTYLDRTGAMSLRLPNA